MKKIYIAHTVKEFEEFVNRKDIQLIEEKFGMLNEQTSTFQEYFWGIVYYKTAPNKDLPF